MKEVGSGQHHKRSIFLINRKFQLTFIAYMVVAVAIAIFAFYMSFIYFFKQMIYEGHTLPLPSDHHYFLLLEMQKAFMLKVFIITSIIVFLFLFAFGLLLGHRIAGPIMRLQNKLQKIIEGKQIQSLKFRENDFFQELPSLFNQAMEKLNKK